MANDLERILEIKSKSEDDFEKNITYISAGTLVLSLTFIEKIVNLKDAKYIDALKWSWICLVVTLLVNLSSHQLASWFGDMTYVEERDDVQDRDKKVLLRNLFMRIINCVTIGTLTFGISLLIYFATKNAYAMVDKNENRVENPLHQDPNYFEKGRTFTPPKVGGDTSTQQSSPSQNASTGNNTGSNTTQTPKKD